MKIHFFVFKMDQMRCDDALTIAKHIPKMKIILYLHQKKEIDDAFTIAQHIPNTIKIFFLAYHSQKIVFVHSGQMIRVHTSILGELGLACLAFCPGGVWGGQREGITIFYFSTPPPGQQLHQHMH